ncbi:hypothetical protein Tco_0056337 [Tanacetum coccineum]
MNNVSIRNASAPSVTLLSVLMPEPSNHDSLFRCLMKPPLTINTYQPILPGTHHSNDPEALRMYDKMRELEATGEHTTAEINDVDFIMSLMRSDNRFADAFARYDSGGASGSRARDSDDTGGEDGGDDTS